MRQVAGFRDRSTERGTFEGEFGARAIVTNGNFTASVCDCGSTVGASVWSGACGGRGIAVLDGVQVVQLEGEVLGVFVPHFHNGKCHWVADGKMFPFGKSIIGKLDSWAFW